MNRVALIGENSVEYISTLVDIWNNRDCAVLIDWRIPLQTAAEMMHEANVHTCYIEKNLFNKSITTSGNISFVLYERKNVSAKYLPKSIYDKFEPNYSQNEAIIIYSSGTTGKSRGIILSHFAINTNADAILDYMKIDLRDCLYIAKALSHSSALTGELLVSLKSKAKLVVAPTVVPPRFVLNNIDKFGVTTICLNPTLLQMYVREYNLKPYPLRTLKTIYVSGSILNDKIYMDAHQTFKNIAIYNVYGLSETGPRVTAQRAECCKGNSVGKQIKDIEIAITNEDGKFVANGVRGTIHVKTPSLFSGYIVGENKHASFLEGWYNTGDVGYIDTNGELYITGRLDDVIIIDSHKIYPSEVEKQIVALSDIKECVVVKAECNDREFIGCLYISEYTISQNIKNTLESKLSVYEIPKLFLKCEFLPKNKNGKILRRAAVDVIQKELKKRGLHEKSRKHYTRNYIE